LDLRPRAYASKFCFAESITQKDAAMPYDPRLTFTLRQHTPLIHFQPQNGTLRATEIKPKLDKYVIQKLDKLGKGIPSTWCIGGESAKSKALDYKLHFASTCLGNTPKKIIDKNKDKHLLTLGDITGTAISFHPDLLAFIKTSLSEFFALHNFGNRTSKGYGCFTVEKIDGQPPSPQINPQDYFESLLKNAFDCFYKKDLDLVRLYLKRKLLKDQPSQSNEWDCLKNNLRQFINKEIDTIKIKDSPADTMQEMLCKAKEGLIALAKSKNIKDVEINKRIIKPLMDLIISPNMAMSDDLLDSITEDWRDLKSGRNRPYARSLLMEYFCEHRVRWEKRKIKRSLDKYFHKVFTQIKNNNPDRENTLRITDYGDESFKEKYIRAILGLADHFEYPAKKRGDSIKINVCPEATPEYPDDTVDRFQSPVLFKAFENSIYMIPLPIPRELATRADGQPRQFKFIVNWKLALDKGEDKDEKDLFSLSVPQDFNVVDFFDAKLKKSSRPGFNPKEGKTIAELLEYRKVTRHD
jgi:hypothetical protein